MSEQNLLADKEDPATEKARLEAAKLRLETKKLKQDLDWMGRFSSRVWPMVATTLTILLSVIAIVISIKTQSDQANLQKKLADDTLAFNRSVHHDDSLRAAITLATDKTGDSDRRIAGIWQLNSAWGHPDDYEMVASTLTAELGLPDGNRAARCAAAQVIGQALGSAASANVAEADRDRLGRLLFGDSSGVLGLVTIQNVMASQATEANVQDASKPCQTGLDATREAIRKNWIDLRGRNFATADLRGIPLYKADLSGASLYRTKVQNANFRCSNLRNVSVGDAEGKGSADFLYSNVSEDNDPETKELVAQGYLFQLTDAAWRQWRDKGMRIDSQGKPALSSSEGTELQCVGSDIAGWQKIREDNWRKLNEVR